MSGYLLELLSLVSSVTISEDSGMYYVEAIPVYDDQESIIVEDISLESAIILALHEAKQLPTT